MMVVQYRSYCRLKATKPDSICNRHGGDAGESGRASAMKPRQGVTIVDAGEFKAAGIMS